ncbi:MAG: hypothetical protein FJ241_04720 [Nitrospira sp.]|nr:hypothetical protein [Nitrospira sp.]
MIFNKAITKKILITIAFILSLVMVSTTSAQALEIANGFVYLVSTQNPDGSWGSDTTDTELLPSTVSVIEAFQVLNQTGIPSYANAISWLQSQSLYTTDYLSERIHALSVAVTDDDLLLSYFDDLTGAWGGYDEFEVDNLDTSLALLALKRINYQEQNTVSYALGYLIGNQNTDGGWGFYPSTCSGCNDRDESNVYMTALVLKTFNVLSSMFNLKSSIEQASAYLLTKQNPDGGFAHSASSGQGSSTVYETALAFESLIVSSVDISAVASSAINYLTSTQLPNGSWDDDPYSTALALRALANVKPNLSISFSDITFSNPAPSVGETITITANIRNTGPSQADNVLVQFYDGNPLVGGVLIGETIVPSILAYGSSQAIINWTIPTASSRIIFVKTDPSNSIDELNETDNIAFKNFTSATLPDLSITSDDITFTPQVPITGQSVTITATVRNIGETGAGNVTIDFYDGDPSAGGILIGNALVQSIGAGSFAGVQLTTEFITGSHNIYVVLDRDNSIAESNEANNTATKVLHVGGGFTELSINRNDITFNPAYPVEGDPVLINAAVHNEGNGEVNDVLVRFYLGDPDSGGIQIGSDITIPSISARNVEIVNTTWDSTGHAGNNNIYVKVDPLNIIPEVNELNNKALKTLKVSAVTGADLTVSSADINYTPLTPTKGEIVTITANIRNTGTSDAGNIFVEFSLGNPDMGGTLIIGSQTIPLIAAGSSALAQILWDTTGYAGTYEIYVNADPFNAIAELSETNNTAHMPITITAPQGPDLTIKSIDSANLITDTQSLAVTGTILITVENKGNQVTNSSFEITAFEDRNNNKQFDTVTDNILGNVTYTNNLGTGESNAIDVPVSGNVLFRDNLIYVMADSNNSIEELDETNNTKNTGEQCGYQPPVGTFNPVEKWVWTGSSVLPEYNQVMQTPAVANLTDDNNDGFIDEKDIPDIIFGTFIPGWNYCTGVLRAVSGDSGREIFTVTNPAYMVSTCSGFAVGDIDNDGKVEIVARKSGLELDNGIIVFEHDGRFKWRFDDVYVGIGGPSIADLDNDGIPKVIVGTTVLNNDGTLKWQGLRGTEGNTGVGPLSLIADIDLDGRPEVVAGNTTYRYDGTEYWWNTLVRDGYNAVANFDDDPYPEIVLVTFGAVYLLEHTGEIKWGPVMIPDDGRGGAPTVADFDGDGQPEIGVAGLSRYVVLDTDGSILWQSIIQDGSSHVTGSSVFDFDGDGEAEVVYNDEYYLRIYKGKNGQVLFSTPNTSGTLTEYPLIVDVDNDNRAEIVVGANNWYTGGGIYGIRVFEDANDNWVNTRKIWNQHTYHITNVNDDGTIPRYEQNNWEVYNNYRCNSLLPEDILGTSDITASYITIDQTNYPTSVYISARIGNGGAVSQITGVDVAFYDGNPSQGGVLIGTTNTTKTLHAGDYEDVFITWNNPASGNHTIFVVADKDNKFNECREGNNTASAEIEIGIITPPVYLPDLSVSQGDITIIPPDMIEGQDANIGAVIHNNGNTDAYTIEVKFYDGDPETGTLIGTATIPFIQSGGTSYIQMPWNTFGQSGRNYIHVIIDPQNLIAESNENNNSTLKPVDVTPPAKPDLTVTSTDIVFSNQNPKEGDLLTITTTIHNLGTDAGSIEVNLYDGIPGNGGTLLNTYTIYPIIPFGGQAQVTFDIDTVGFSGNHNFHFIIDPDNTIEEQREDNNSASANLLIGTIGLNLTETTDKTLYQENEDVQITVNTGDLQNELRNLLVDVRIFDSGGFLVASLPALPLTLNPLETRTLNFLWNTGNTLIGNYVVKATVFNIESDPLARQSVPINITSSLGISTNLFMDRILYYPNEPVRITSAVSNNSLNKIYENLTATVSIKDTSGQILFTGDTTINILTPSSYYSFSSYWNTSTKPQGEYPVTLEVKDASGNILSFGTKSITITSDIKPSKLLKGQISVDKQSLLQGEPVAITCSVTNIGNMNLSDISLSILTVHVVELTIYDTLTDQTSLQMGETYTNTQQLDTQNYSAKDYLVILRANISGVEETLASTYFRVEGAPSAPSLYLPRQGEDVETLTPVLIINNASDPNDDNLTYEFELYTDSNLSNLVASSGMIPEGNNVTSWQVPSELNENATYYWRARAFDGRLYGEWMLPASFRVNLVNEPPTAPTLSSPADNSEVSTLTPILTVNNASDPDSSNLTYNFELALDADFTQIVASEIGIFEGIGTTSWEVPISLNENTYYYWRAQADDWLIEGPWMTPARFFVNTANDAPSAPSILSPSNGSEIMTLSFDIVVSNSTDPENNQLTYVFEIDTVMTFDSPNIIRSGNIPEGQGITSWHVEGLNDNTYYYVRTKASDGLAESPWSEVIGFFVNTSNDAPTIPVLANPSDGAGVNVFNPTPSVHNSSDIDRDVLTYEFEVYEDVGMLNLVSNVTGVIETPQITSWTVPVNLIENKTYYWRVRAYDGELYSGWMPFASFMINTANDAPSAPLLHSPAEGSSLDTLYPTLSVYNAQDPDSDTLTYDFEVCSDDQIIQSITGIPENISGLTSITLTTALSDNTIYQWRARAYDGDRYSAWMNMAKFSIHLPSGNITATIDFDPDTLNKKCSGKWVTVYIELPSGYNVADIVISSIRLGGTIPVEPWPYSIGDHDRDGIPDLMVKFKRSDVINLLPCGDNVSVIVTGTVGTITFEGVDWIRVIP